MSAGADGAERPAETGGAERRPEGGGAERRVAEVATTDYHTGGEPFRIVTNGVPTPEGRTVLERRRWAAAHLDEIRRLLVNEPRGHADMYGGFVTPPDDAGADLGVVFFHNEGYSTACGHGTIALVTWAIETGRIAAPAEGEVAVVVDVPSGRLPCVATLRHGRVERVSFRNVPAFVLARAVAVPTTRGVLRVDVAFGGAFYGSVRVADLGLRVEPAALPELIALQRELRPALDAALEVVHPLESELRGIYGIIFWDEPDEPPAPPTAEADATPDAPRDRGPEATLVQRNVTVFANGEVDRSPCGSGTSARLALLDAEGALAAGGRLLHRGIVGSVFEGRVVIRTELAGRPAVVTEVAGTAHATGRHVFTLDPTDPLGTGFLLR